MDGSWSISASEILQLVAEAEGATGLIEGRPRRNPAGQHLVGQPAIEQVVQRTIRGFDMDLAEELAPARAVGFERAVEVGSDGFRRKGFRCGIVVAVAQHEGEFSRVAGLQNDIDGECRARVAIMAHLAGTVPSRPSQNPDGECRPSVR